MKDQAPRVLIVDAAMRHYESDIHKGPEALC
jgi:hypothetical protein